MCSASARSGRFVLIRKLLEQKKENGCIRSRIIENDKAKMHLHSLLGTVEKSKVDFVNFCSFVLNKSSRPVSLILYCAVRPDV